MGDSAHVISPASGQPELLLVADLRSGGMDETEIRAHARGMVRVRRGAYAATTPDGAAGTHRARTVAVVRQHGGGVAASHMSAALIHGFPLAPEHLDLVHVTSVSVGPAVQLCDTAAVPLDASGRNRSAGGATGDVKPRVCRGGVRHGVHTHVSARPGAQVEYVDGLLVTNAVRTVIDCALVLPFTDAVVIADHALHAGLATSTDLSSALAAVGRRKGIGRARRVLASADAGAESPGETRLRLIVTDAGYAVESQVELRDPSGRLIARVDLRLRDHAVVLEFDGRVKYGLKGDVEKAHWDEKRRHDDVQNLGFVARRFRWEHLARPPAIVRVVDLAVERARRRGGVV